MSTLNMGAYQPTTLSMGAYQLFGSVVTPLASAKRNLNDFWKLRLNTDGFASVAVNDLMKEALLNKLGLSQPPVYSVDDLWKRYLIGQGYSGDLNTMMKKWLQGKGYTQASIPDLIRALDENAGTIQ